METHIRFRFRLFSEFILFRPLQYDETVSDFELTFNKYRFVEFSSLHLQRFSYSLNKHFVQETVSLTILCYFICRRS